MFYPASESNIPLQLWLTTAHCSPFTRLPYTTIVAFRIAQDRLCRGPPRAKGEKSGGKSGEKSGETSKRWLLEIGWAKKLRVKHLVIDQMKLQSKYWEKLQIKFRTKLGQYIGRNSERAKLPSTHFRLIFSPEFSPDFPVSSTDPLGRQAKGETADFLCHRGVLYNPDCFVNLFKSHVFFVFFRHQQMLKKRLSQNPRVRFEVMEVELNSLRH